MGVLQLIDDQQSPFRQFGERGEGRFSGLVCVIESEPTGGERGGVISRPQRRPAHGPARIHGSGSERTQQAGLADPSEALDLQATAILQPSRQFIQQLRSSMQQHRGRSIAEQFSDSRGGLGDLVLESLRRLPSVIRDVHDLAFAMTAPDHMRRADGDETAFLKGGQRRIQR